MKMNKFQQDIKDYVLSGHSLLNVNTYEKDRCCQQIHDVAKNTDRQVFVWNAASGMSHYNGTPVQDSSIDPPFVIKDIQNLPEKSICILKEFGIYLKHETFQTFDVVIAWIDFLKQTFSAEEKTIIFLDTSLEVPQCLSKDITVVDFPLPDKEDIKKAISFVVESVKDNNKDFENDESSMPDIVDSCKGMTQQQIVDRASLAVVKQKKLNQESVKIILNEKAGVIKNSGYLTYKECPEDGFSLIGGANALKRHLLLDKPCFSEKAIKYGIDPPKGIVLAGISGTGKSQFCYAIAGEFKMPLVALDIGAIFGSLVGESEKNIREAIKIIDSISPVVLQLDEVEKAFGGQGDLDGGSSKRVLGTFLTWMNDRKSSVYVVATCNDVSVLPMEFCRAGRFDAIFGIGLPSEKEREEIFNIHLKKRKRDSKNFDIEKLAKSTKDFTGADIEQVVKLGLKIGFQQQQELQNNHLLTAIDSTIPLARVEPERIKTLKEWIDKHAKLANPPETEERTVRRRVSLSK